MNNYNSNLYSRQVETYGLDTMKKILDLKIIVIGLRGLGIEISKNLILSGIKKITLFDDNLCLINDLSSNFFISEDDIKINRRDKACLNKLSELNPYVEVSLIEKKSEIKNQILENDVLIITRGKPLQLYKAITKGRPPAPRCETTMNFFEKLNVIIIHGGRNEYDINGPFFNDFYFFDVERLIWIKLETNDGIIPIYPRGAHSSCIVDNELIIFGGFNDKYFLKSDLVICDLDIIESTHLLKKNKTKKIKKKMKIL